MLARVQPTAVAVGDLGRRSLRRYKRLTKLGFDLWPGQRQHPLRRSERPNRRLGVVEDGIQVRRVVDPVFRSVTVVASTEYPHLLSRGRGDYQLGDLPVP